MRTAESSSSAPPLLSETQRSALVSLLADDDPAVYRLVRAKLLAYGEVACLWLRPHALSGDPKMRRRAQEILNYHGRLHHDARFVDYAKRHGEDLDLEEGVGFLTRTRYPDVTWEGYSALLDQWAATIQGQMQPQTRAEHALGIINHFLFEELGFQGSDQVGYDPECCFLNRIIDQRKGNPIGLCTLYLFIARRLRLPITGIGLPSHFVCRYQSTTAEIYID